MYPLRINLKETGSETYISTPQHPEEKDSRFYGADEDTGRESNFKKTKSEGKETPGGLKQGSYRFTKQDRLLKRHEFLNVFKNGKRRRLKSLTFIFKENGLNRSRLGLVVSRAVGKAHYRNYLKRVTREIFRLNRSCLINNIDLVVQVNPGAARSDYKSLEQEFARFADKAAG